MRRWKPIAASDVTAARGVELERLEGLIEQRSARIGVVGLGYVGLPLAVEFAKAGFQVVGIELDRLRVQRTLDGDNYIGDVRDEELRGLVGAGRLSATSDWDRVAELDVLILCLPTPFNRNKEPDLSAITGAAREIGGRLRAGQLIVLESTTYPGTTEEVLLPLLSESGHQAVRVHELSARAWRRRTLYPRRPRLSRLEGEGVRLLHELHQPRVRGERQHAVLRRPEGDAGARGARQADEWSQGAGARRDLQARYQRRPEFPRPPPDRHPRRGRG